MNAQGSRVIIVVVAAVKIYVAAVQAGAQEKNGKTRWNAILPPKLGGGKT